MFKNTDCIENEIAVDIEQSIEQTIAITDSCRCPEPTTTCNCCCKAETNPVTFQRCDDNETISPTAELLCTGRLLTVNVNVTACKGRTVAVGVLLCSGNTPIRFKVCEDVIPGTPDPSNPCATKTFKFCFIFKSNLCTETLSLNIKTFAEYANFPGFSCTC